MTAAQSPRVTVRSSATPAQTHTLSESNRRRTCGAPAASPLTYALVRAAHVLRLLASQNARQDDHAARTEVLHKAPLELRRRQQPTQLCE